MEVKIGVQHASRELVLDTAESGEEVTAAVAKALTEGETMVTLTDIKGRTILIPADKLAYIEIGSDVVGQVGFRS